MVDFIRSSMVVCREMMLFFFRLFFISVELN